MKILYVASEAAPFCASGGLGDVMGALPKAVAKAHEEDEVSVVLPLYSKIKEEYRKEMRHVVDLSFNLSWRQTGASVFCLKKEGVRYYFIENGYYFNRPNLYGDYDDAERFAFFSMAVVEWMLNTSESPDVLNANDWQSAAVVIYLKTIFKDDPKLAKIRTVFTVHNIEYQGKFDRFLLGDVFSIDEKYADSVEYDGCLNLMKGALSLSDYITTVSPTYASELQYDFFAYGLSGVISSIRHKMTGIINGIDYDAFSPENGKDIPYVFSLETLKEGKENNKKALLQKIGLPYDEKTPLFVMITRLADQKGIDLVSCILDEALSMNMQFVILGTGDLRAENFLREAEGRHPGKMRALIRFDRALSKEMYAAADVFIMPSKFEPCGLAQMIACSYGTVPIVRTTGGLADTIIPYGVDNANGFRFDDYNAHALLATMKRAVTLYETPQEWEKIRISAKKSRFTWDQSAEEYHKIYENITKW